MSKNTGFLVGKVLNYYSSFTSEFFSKIFSLIFLASPILPSSMNLKNIWYGSPKSEKEVKEAYNFLKTLLQLSESHPRQIDYYLKVFKTHPGFLTIAKLNQKIIGCVFGGQNMWKPNAKDDLLGSVNEVLDPVKKLDFTYLLFFILGIILVLSILFPKVYLTQQIYFKSREISKLKSEYDTLKEENKVIGASVEAIRYKNQILDTLF